jgi:hypothetical protein
MTVVILPSASNDLAGAIVSRAERLYPYRYNVPNFCFEAIGSSPSKTMARNTASTTSRNVQKSTLTLLLSQARSAHVKGT